MKNNFFKIQTRMFRKVAGFFILVGLILSQTIITEAQSADRGKAGTAEELGPKYKIITKPSETLFIKKTESENALISNVTAGAIQGVDTNPYLDSTHKADNYTQELLDMHFSYPISRANVGYTDARFGFSVNNITYYNATDFSIFDGVADVNIDQRVFKDVTMTNGYVFEYLWYPHDCNGTYVANEFHTSFRHKINERVYQKYTYRIKLKNYLARKIQLDNGDTGSKLREDLTNYFEHELGAYITSRTKLRIANQFYINDSNYEYLNYYNYFAYRTGGALTQILTRKLSSVTGFYYQRKNYYSRVVSDKQKQQRDNLWVVSTSLMYDVTKSVSIFVNYSHMENHTNEPLERYTDNLYSAGLYYSF